MFPIRSAVRKLSLPGAPAEPGMFIRLGTAARAVEPSGQYLSRSLGLVELPHHR